MDQIFLNKSVTRLAPSASIGLFTGKIGICLYLFKMGNTVQARELLHTIYTELPMIKNNIKVEDGLCGIGIAINYMVEKGFIKGDVNKAFQEIDNRVFQELAYEQNCWKYDLPALIHIVYYLTSRWKKQDKNSHSEYILRKLITQVLNDIYKRIESQSIEEPLHYTLDYILPQLLFTIQHLYSQNLCRQRIERITKEISPIILSTIPRVQANRLYLLSSINTLSLHGICDDEWRKHCNILLNNIDIDYILSHELGDKSIYVNNGISGLYYLIKQIPQNNISMKKIIKQAITLIDNSTEWDLLANNQAYLKSHIGLYNGVCGVALAYNMMKTELKK